MATPTNGGDSLSPPSLPPPPPTPSPDWLTVLGEVSVASHVLSALGMADVAALRLACRACADAVREHDWTDDATGDIDSAGAFALPPVSVGDGFARWRRCFPRATAVSLVRSSARPLDDTDLAALDGFTSVRLHWHHRADADVGQGELSPAGTAHLRRARRLHVRRVTFVNGALMHLTGAHELYFEHCRGVSAEAARGLPLAARKAVFRYSDAADDVTDGLLRLLPHVETLELSFVNGATGSAFAALPALHTLRLHQLPRLVPAAFAGLEGTRLKELFFIEETGIQPIMSDALLGRLAALERLTLWTTAPGFTGACLASLPLLTRVTLLWCGRVTDDALAALTGVTHLSLCCCHGVTGGGLRSLPTLVELTVDWCSALEFGDGGGGGSGDWPCLRRLELRVKSTAARKARAALTAALLAPRGGALARTAAHTSVTFTWTAAGVVGGDGGGGSAVSQGEEEEEDDEGMDADPAHPKAAARAAGAPAAAVAVDDGAPPYVVDIPPRPEPGCGAGRFPPQRRRWCTMQ
jgi:hypothetical protein